MNKIERKHDWCSHDFLDGHQLRDGEKLKIKFKDGSAKVRVISVRTWNETIGDMGHFDSYPQSEAYITMKVRGETVDLKLAGLEAERLNPPKKEDRVPFHKRRDKYTR